jgi:hypothetical protein
VLRTTNLTIWIASFGKLICASQTIDAIKIATLNITNTTVSSVGVISVKKKKVTIKKLFL